MPPGALSPVEQMTLIRSFLIALLATFLLSACEGVKTERANPEDPKDKIRESGGKLFGDINLIGPDRSGDNAGAGSGIGVNGFLWRASLDTLSFLPLASADPFGGVIITDWYSPPESPNERFKVTAYILGRQLRSDGIRIAVFRQVAQPGRGWVDSKVEDQTGAKLEAAILSRARELRIASSQQ